MGADLTPQLIPDYAVPPGDTLLEVIDALGVSQAELAERTGRPKKTVNEIVNGKAAITPETALQLERVLGLSADFWNTLEQRYRAALARLAEREALSEQTGWLAQLPVKALIKYGWVEAKDTAVEQLGAVLSFFGVASVDAWHEVWGDVRRSVAFRESPSFESDFGAVAAWLRQGELEARRIDTAPFDAARFKTSLTEIRTLSRTTPDVFAPRLISICAAAGVAVVFVPALPKLRVCGATRWLSPNKAMMLLTLRYKTNDHLWFTFFHEAGHILLHGKRAIFVEESATPRVEAAAPSAGRGEDAEHHERAVAELEAHRFAGDTLIPPAAYSQFRRGGTFSADAIRAFAKEFGIAPGIVLGRLQHDHILPYPTRLNTVLKERFELVPADQAERGAQTAC